MFNRFSLRTKLIACFFGGAVTAVVVGAIGIWSSSRMAEKYERIAQVSMPSADLLEQMLGSSKDLIMVVLESGHSDIHAAQIPELKERINRVVARHKDMDKKYVAIPFVPGEEELYKSLTAAWTNMISIASKGIEIGATEKEKFPAFQEHELDPATEDYAKRIEALIEFQDKQAEISVAEARHASSWGLWLALIVTIGGGITGIAVGFLFSNSLARSLIKISDDLGHGALEVQDASISIAEGSTELAEGATEQASALQETVSAVDEVNSMVQKNAENASHSKDSSSQSRDIASKGRQEIQGMIQAMHGINQSNQNLMKQIETSNHEMEGIVKVIGEIGNKTTVINEIVFQTKLLSFNASVEAARAGEQGKGFAVVAEEVGSLARMSGTAAKEIADMLQGSIQKVEAIARGTKENVERLLKEVTQSVSGGLSTAQNCGQVFDQIVHSIDDLSRMTGEIAQASSEQSRGVNEITKAMNQLNQATQQNTAVAQQSASAAEQLRAQATSMNHFVKELTETVHGSKASLRSEPPKQPSSATNVKTPPVRVKLQRLGFQKASGAPEEAPRLKKVVGGSGLPSGDDSRFKDF